MTESAHPTDEQIRTLAESYDLGDLLSVEPFTTGTVQSNHLLRTAAGAFVLRLYRNRDFDAVRFEVDLLTHLAAHAFPCAAPIPDRTGRHVAEFAGKPAVLFEYIEGEHDTTLSSGQEAAVLRAIARLHDLTADFTSPYLPSRANYSIASCRRHASAKAARLNTPDAFAKRDWIHARLDELVLPDDLPRTICHADLSSSNILFSGDTLLALLDFDDANRTWPLFDLAFAVDLWAWDRAAALDTDHARRLIHAYHTLRPLSDLERAHLFDVHKFLILLDSVWYMHRGSSDDFIEKSKLAHLDALGRPAYTALTP